MITIRFLGAFGIGLLLTFSPAVRRTSAEEPSAVPSNMEIEVAIAQLEDKDTRLLALEELIPLCYGRRLQPAFQQREIGKRAEAALVRCRNVETIGMALESDNVIVQRWALGYFPLYPEDDDPDVDPGRWRELLPRVRGLARGDDAVARALAQDILRHNGGQREFLAELVKTETSADNVMRMLNDLDRHNYRQEMNKHLLRILSHEDEAVRKSAMLFVGFNSNRAPMWQFEFSDAVCKRVLALSYSRSAVDRSAAVDALDDLPDYDPKTVRQRLFELARDPADDVRWRIPVALRPYVARSDVQEVLTRLLEDPSPLVRYFTIVALGPEKHEDKLRLLAAGPDKRAAEFAAGQLRKLERMP